HVGFRMLSQRGLVEYEFVFLAPLVSLGDFARTQGWQSRFGALHAKVTRPCGSSPIQSSIRFLKLAGLRPRKQKAHCYFDQFKLDRLGCRAARGFRQSFRAAPLKMVS